MIVNTRWFTLILCCLALAPGLCAAAPNYIALMNQGRTLSPETVQALEKALQDAPWDLIIRAQLMGYYTARSAQDPNASLARLKQVDWLIDNRPDFPVLHSDAGMADLRLRAAWQHQIDLHPDDPLILENAAWSLNFVDYEIPAACLKKLRQSQPSDPRWALTLGTLYARQLMSMSGPNTKALAELMGSDDSAVVGIAGVTLYASGRVGSPPKPFAALGENLLKKAHDLDPQNPHWPQALQSPPPKDFSVAVTAVMAFKLEDLWHGGVIPSMSVPAGAVRVAPSVQASKLVESQTPWNPPELGRTTPHTVRLDALIWKNGRIRNLEVLGGDLNLITFALDSVRQWVYQPTLVNGQPVSVVAEIDVDFPVPRPPPLPKPPPPPGVAGGAGGVIGGIVSSTPPPPPSPLIMMPKRITVGGAIQGARVISRASPVYPPLARAARIQGLVQLDAVIDEEGKIFELQVISGHPLLTQAALDAVWTWRYQPTVLNQVPVQVATRIDVNFTLSPPGPPQP